MEYIQGKPRSQIVLFESCLEERIEKDNPVRAISSSCLSMGILTVSVLPDCFKGNAGATWN